MSTPTFAVRVVRGAGLRDELEIVYDGTAPPTAFFDDLRAIGWQPPVLAPPPAAAIDWSRPDPRTGTRYTLRPYEAIGRAVGGVGAQEIAVVERVIARHLTPTEAPPAPQPSTPAAPVAVSRPAPVVAPLTPLAPRETEPATREREVQVGATVDEESAPAVRDALAQRGLAVRSTRMSLASPGGYRGATTDGQQSAVRLQMRVPISQIDEVVSILGPNASDVVVRR
jgi:hypothetical protein